MLIVSSKEKIASDIWSVRLTDSREEITAAFQTFGSTSGVSPRLASVWHRGLGNDRQMHEFFESALHSSSN